MGATASKETLTAPAPMVVVPAMTPKGRSTFGLVAPPKFPVDEVKVMKSKLSPTVGT